MIADKQQRIAELSAQIRRWNEAYFNTGVALVEDPVYDAAKDELKSIDPENLVLKEVGATPKKMGTEVALTIPMGSLDKVRNRDEFVAWTGRFPGAYYTGSYKMDGGSVEITYVVGALVQGSTRGDGITGEDVTANAFRFQRCPKTGVKIAGKLFTGFIRGELMLTNEDWAKAEPDMSTNPRNVGNGIVRRRSGKHADLLTVFAFRAHYQDGSEIASTRSEMNRLLADAGFGVTPWASGTAEDIWAFYTKTHKERPALPFWLDGVVIELDDLNLQKELGTINQYPRGARAIKFPPVFEQTVLRSVEFTVGHTGAIVPTGKFDPVQLQGTTVSSALLCNSAVIRELNIAVFDTVNIYKAGDIIPRVMDVIARPPNRVPIVIPSVCPVCGGRVGKKQTIHGEDTALDFCLNEECTAKIVGKIERFIKSLEIAGIGTEVLAAIVTNLGVKSAADLYRLNGREAELNALLVGDKKIRLGEKRAKKIIDEIEKRRELTLAEFLGSLGIDGLGKRRVVLMQQKAPGELDSLENWLSGKLGELVISEEEIGRRLLEFEASLPKNPEIESDERDEAAEEDAAPLGAEAARLWALNDSTLAGRAGVPNMGPRISADLIGKKGLIEEFLANGVVLKAAEIKMVSANAKSFCFTGASSMPRSQMKSLVEAKGHVVKDDVAKGLDYLVMADPTSTSSKAVKARKLGTKCITEQEMVDILAGSPDLKAQSGPSQIDLIP